VLDQLARLFREVFGEVPAFSVVILVLSLLATSAGFSRPPWFFGVGSGFATGAMSIVTILAYRHRLGALAGVQLGLLLVHGVRLSVFLIMREHKPSFHHQQLAEHTARPMRFGRRALVWIAVSLLYFCMFSPALYATVGRQMLPPSATTALQIAGIMTMAAGFILELTADAQKTAFKMYQPEACCYSGLFRWVRQPNHLGELMFWVGNFIAAIGFYLSVMHWVISVAGLIGLTMLLIAVAARLEYVRAVQYGTLAEYQAYTRTVPVLLPWLPARWFSPR